MASDAPRPRMGLVLDQVCALLLGRAFARRLGCAHPRKCGSKRPLNLSLALTGQRRQHQDQRLCCRGQRAAERHPFSKVRYIVALHNKHIRGLTFENLCQAN
jgi:hypothetical protein